MVITFGLLKSRLARYVGDGFCDTAPEVAEAINLASGLLLEEGDWAGTRQRYKLKVSNNCVALPRYVESVIAANFCNTPGDTWDMAYEFLGSGPGTLDHGVNTRRKDLVDLGNRYPTFFPINPNATGALSLMALSTNKDDVGKKMVIKGWKTNLDEHGVEGTPGIEVTIGKWQHYTEGKINDKIITDYATDETFEEVYYVEKPVTKGYITLMGIDKTIADTTFTLATDDVGIVMLSKYYPDETKPFYRRYRITATDTGTEDTILALVKIKHEDMVNDSDIAPIQHIQAHKMMVMALHEQERGDLQKGILLQQNAIRLLNNQLKNVNKTLKTVDIRYEGYGIGTESNII